MTRRSAACLPALALVAAASCTGAAAPPAPIPAEIGAAGYADLVASHRGRILIVNMWATWCEPCRDEFPDLVRLHERNAASGVDLVAISMDLPGLLESDVVPFLTEQGASFPAFIKAPGDDEAFINGVDPNWSGALPATFVYDAEGRLFRSIVGPTTYAELDGVLTDLR